MKNLFKILIFVAPFFQTIQVESQDVAGYLGKHWIANYDLSFSPAFLYSSYSNDDFVTFNAINSLGADYIYQQYKALSFSARYCHTSVFFRQPLMYTVLDNSYYSSYNYGSYEQSFVPDTSASINAFEFDFGIKKFSELLAPLGGFNTIEFGYITYKVNAVPSMFLVDLDDYYNNPALVTQPEVTIKNRYGAFKLSYTWGKQWVVLNKVALRMGISSGWVFGGLKMKMREIFDLSGTGYISGKEYVELASKNRLWGQNILNFNLGIGFIAH